MNEYIYETQGEQVIGNLKGFILPKEEIVRCRDCLKWDYDSPYPKKACFEFSNPEDGYIVMTSPDGFCAWPERRIE